MHGQFGFAESDKFNSGLVRADREELERLHDFAIELKEFHDELLRVAGLPYKPNLNDGVLITARPLWKLFRLPKWQKDLKACWESLEAGEYDWAHLAYTIWPDRVKEVCKKGSLHRHRPRAGRPLRGQSAGEEGEAGDETGRRGAGVGVKRAGFERRAAFFQARNWLEWSWMAGILEILSGAF